ncbi:hypothetical protein GCM10023219_10590 [Stakelama sediminis]|uniref:Uncharacterized protein n=1 Tax=Stakelama sediminis TaxID=463200 RepID=A0A840YVW7_9SPHN|nr:hypothetical protein [Stakelama sediminis]MBB5717783.1 hypothetical protein [Stakelama sediminis]
MDIRFRTRTLTPEQRAALVKAGARDSVARALEPGRSNPPVAKEGSSLTQALRAGQADAATTEALQRVLTGLVQTKVASSRTDSKTPSKSQAMVDAALTGQFAKTPKSTLATAGRTSLASAAPPQNQSGAANAQQLPYLSLAMPQSAIQGDPEGNLLSGITGGLPGQGRYSGPDLIRQRADIPVPLPRPEGWNRRWQAVAFLGGLAVVALFLLWILH